MQKMDWVNNTKSTLIQCQKMSLYDTKKAHYIYLVILPVDHAPNTRATNLIPHSQPFSYQAHTLVAYIQCLKGTKKVLK